MKVYTLFAIALTLTCVGFAKAQAPVESIYTDLIPGTCKTIQIDKETGGSAQSCPGPAGYNLLVADDDSRESITVVAPDGKEHPLEFWRVITTAFSSVGNKAEWRIVRKKNNISLLALIVRVNANEDVDHPNRVRSYLAVAKITPQQICVTDKIGPSAKANEEARRAADTSLSKPCLNEAARRPRRVTQGH